MLKNGFEENEIKSEIYNYFSKENNETIKKSFSYIFSVIVLSIISISPLLGCFFETEIYYAIISLVLILLTFGYQKFNKKCILTWLSIILIFVTYILLIFFVKLSGKSTNSLYSYQLMVSLLLFSSVLSAKIFEVYKRKRNLNEQFNFK